MGVHPIASARGGGSRGGGAWRRLFTICCLTLTACHVSIVAFAQVIGEHAEMERLRVKTDEAISNGDADSAAMNSGKAALMAQHLARREGDNATGDWYRGAEALFRSQEHAYRAMALFQRAGGEPPASTGVCQSIRLAQQEGERAAQWFGKTGRSQIERGNAPDPPLSVVATDWQRTVEALWGEFQCSG